MILSVLLKSLSSASLVISNKLIEYFAQKARVFAFRGHHFYGGALNCNSTVVDLGANLGEFSYQITSTFGCKCYTVEPVPSLFSKIEENHLIKKFNYAINSTDKPVTIYISENPEANSIYKPLAAYWKSNKCIVVNGIRLKSFLDIAEIKSLDILKIDIEGAEINIFQDIEDELLCNFSQITVEFHDFFGKFNCSDKIIEIKARLKRLGFFCIVFSMPYDNSDVLFINKKKCKLTSLDWFYLYIIKYIFLKIKNAREMSIKYFTFINTKYNLVFKNGL